MDQLQAPHQREGARQQAVKLWHHLEDLMPDGSLFLVGLELYAGRLLALLLRVILLEVHLLEAQALLLAVQPLPRQQEDYVVGLAVDPPGESMLDYLKGVLAIVLHLYVHLGFLLIEEGMEVPVLLLPLAEVRNVLDHPSVSADDGRLLGLRPASNHAHFRHQMVPGL